MTMQEAATYSKEHPEDWVIWCGNRLGVFVELEGLEEAKQYMAFYRITGMDAYGDPVLADSGVWHAGEKLAL